MKLDKAPKQFCENVTIGIGNDFFVIGMRSGEQGVAYALTPKHAKRLMQYLSHQVAEYEKKHGDIVVDPWTPDVKSPLQLGEGDTNDSSK